MSVFLEEYSDRILGEKKMHKKKRLDEDVQRQRLILEGAQKKGLMVQISAREDSNPTYAHLNPNPDLTFSPNPTNVEP